MRSESHTPKNEISYIIYDIESSGLSTTFDQITQFAGIIVAPDFTTILREINIRIKIQKDVIPCPQALLVTNTTPEILEHGTPDNPALDEYTAINKIFDFINTPNTINLGYNSLRFDDQFLRFSFFRNLLPPYKHQFKNNCHRMDIYPIILFAYHFYPDILNWPVINGKVSFKLENLVKANNLSSGNSHDALVDVKDTIKLAKKLAAHKPLWDKVTQFFDKDKDKLQIDNSPGALVINNIPFSAGYLMETNPNEPIIPAMCIGQHVKYQNQTKWLRFDKIDFSETKFEDILKSPLIITKKYGEPPFFFPSNDSLCSEKFGDDQECLILKNVKWLSQNADKFYILRNNYTTIKYPDVNDIDPSTALYKLGLPKFDVQSLFDKFRMIETERKLEVVLKIQDELYKELAIRILASTYPETLAENKNDSEITASTKKDFRERYLKYSTAAFSNNTILDFRGKSKRTLNEALAQANEALKTAQENNDARAQDFLKHLISWYQKRRPEIVNSDRILHHNLPQVASVGGQHMLFSGRIREREVCSEQDLSPQDTQTLNGSLRSG